MYRHRFVWRHSVQLHDHKPTPDLPGRKIASKNTIKAEHTMSLTGCVIATGLRMFAWWSTLLAFASIAGGNLWFFCRLGFGVRVWPPSISPKIKNNSSPSFHIFASEAIQTLELVEPLASVLLCRRSRMKSGNRAQEDEVVRGRFESSNPISNGK